MSTYTTLVVQFPTNKQAQAFSYWLYQEGHAEKSLSGSMVTAHLHRYGDHFNAVAWAEANNGRILTDEIEDDS